MGTKPRKNNRPAKRRAAHSTKRPQTKAHEVLGQKLTPEQYAAYERDYQSRQDAVNSRWHREDRQQQEYALEHALTLDSARTRAPDILKDLYTKTGLDLLTDLGALRHLPFTTRDPKLRQLNLDMMSAVAERYGALTSQLSQLYLRLKEETGEGGQS